MAATSARTASSGWSLTRRLLSPRWIVMHLLVWAAAITMVELGLWQLRVSEGKHFDFQNFSYVLQWWAFAAFTVAFWLRAMYNVHRPPVTAEPGGALVVRGGSGGAGVVAQAGPADLVAPAYRSGDAVVYRGYVIAQSARVAAGSEGDSHHASYNDYLWQLSLADEASRTDRPTANPHPAYPRPENRHADDTAAQPARPDLRVIETAAHSSPTTEQDRATGG